ncbi:HlyD family efflux transporter periplasmic adaptor subunit [Moorena sp. SIO3I6]|uniref:HlyD family efflux transporter periplasmic adaptor subunit n=1 Tax=Moorena sp. SIO3I6 TaxID=2607831 RepID=UPI0013FC5135|nr:HlyD family efflux transporter periplasmic adaptor subunit [Moorena sp. SIO3I6]NEP23794.1 HlyD family efflux transporter periplasmic adaptor subunit [Moorena sp. SIO3I6]
MTQAKPINSPPEAATSRQGNVVLMPSGRLRPDYDQEPVASPSTEVGTNTANAPSTSKWSTSIQTTLDQPPANLPRLLMLGGLSFCTIFVAWATFGQIDEVGKAHGSLVPKGDVYKVDPIEPGKIASIKVKEGQAVKAGEVLVELDTELATQEVERLEKVLNADRIKLVQMQGLLERTRLEAETREQITQAEVQAQQAAIARAQASASAIRQQIIQHQLAKAANRERLQRMKLVQATAQELLQQRRANVVALKERLDNLKPLLAEGAISKEQVFQAEQSFRASQSAVTESKLQEGLSTREQIFQAQQSIRDREAATSQSQGELQQTLAEIKRLEAELEHRQATGRTTRLEAQQKIQQLEVELTQIKARISENETLVTTAKTRLKQKFLKAPVDGIISSLNISNTGQVVQPGHSIAEIAPQGAPLVLSASLPTREAGFINEGMPVQVKFDAYPYQDYGIIKGKVISISSDAKADQVMGSVYKVKVSLDRDYVIEDDEIIRFKAGQTANADIIIRRRRIIDFLLDPMRQLQKSGIDL